MNDLNTRIQAYLDGELSAKETAALERELARSDEALRTYYDWLALHAELNWQHRAVADFDLGAQARAVPSPGRAATTQSARQRVLTHRRPSHFLRTISPWAIAATLVVAIPLVGAFAYWYRVQWEDDSGKTQLPDPVAVLFEISDDAQFTYDGPGDRDYIEFGRSVYPGVVDLKRGTLTFKFNCDAEVTIKGPAKFGLNDDKRAHLHVGQLSAYCPERARGFTIGAPGVAVIDLGTRFTMLVDTLGFTDVAVLDGQVRLDRESGESVALIRGATARAPHNLARRIAIDQPPTPVDPGPTPVATRGSPGAKTWRSTGNNKPINDVDTWRDSFEWDGMSPDFMPDAPGDQGLWIIENGHRVSSNGAAVFFGGTIRIDNTAGNDSELLVKDSDFSVQDVILTGGALNVFQSGSVTGQTITLHDGALGAEKATAHYHFDRWVGDGEIRIEPRHNGNPAPGDAGEVRIDSRGDFSAFTGAFIVRPAASSAFFGFTGNVSEGTFALVVETGATYVLDHRVTLAALTLGDDVIAPGEYRFDDFTPAQQALLADRGGKLIVNPSHHSHFERKSE